MAPRPGPVEPIANPVPGAPDPSQPGRFDPTLQAPDAHPAPLSPPSSGPVTMREVPTPDYRAATTPAQAPPPRQTPVDGGVAVDARASDASTPGSDATTLPPVSDAMPTDAAKTLQP